MEIRTYRDRDYQFLRKMLFEAVFWSRKEDERPELEVGLSYEYTKNILLDFGKRKGDYSVVAYDNDKQIGATFVRYFSSRDDVRGFVSKDIPVLVIGVNKNYRGKGVATKLINELKKLCVKHHILSISLCVTKDNIAFGLYEKTGFKVVEDLGDSYNMQWDFGNE